MQSLVVTGILLLACLAGCAEDPPGDGAPEDGQGPRTSVGGGENGTEDPPHIDVLLLETPFQLIGPSQQTFAIDIPANTTNIDVRLSWPTAAQLAQLTVTIEGCGTWTYNAYYTVGGGGTIGGRVCAEPSSGRHDLTVSNLGYLEGTLRALGQQPIANGTVEA